MSIDVRTGGRLHSVGSDDEKKGSERDTTAGERLPNQRPLAGERLPKQRPHGDEHPEHNPKEHLGVRVPHHPDEAGSSKEVRAITSAAAKENEEFLDKDVEILRLIEERRSTPKEEKQRLKDLSKRIKKCTREKKDEETERHPKNP